MELTAELARELLTYEPDTGDFYWKRNGKKAGCINSHPTQGYAQIYVAGKRYRAHRLAWLMTYGMWPAHEIDHINGKRADNRICNLREVTSSQNKANIGLRSDNKSGVRGVSWHKQINMWRVTIRFNGKERLVGLFHSLDAARKAREQAEIEVFGEFRRIADPV